MAFPIDLPTVQTLDALYDWYMNIDGYAVETFAENALQFSEDELSQQNNGTMINMQNGTTKFQLQELPAEIAKAITECR